MRRPEWNGDVFDELLGVGLVPVVEIADADQAVPLAEALVEGHIRVVEVTFRTPAAEESIRRIARHVPQIVRVAGTVTSTAQADVALDAGAELLVAPGLNREVVEHALGLGIPMMPGVLTPSEVEAGLSLGLEMFKVFPIEPVGGVRYLRALAAPYPKVRWNPTAWCPTIQTSRSWPRRCGRPAGTIGVPSSGPRAGRSRPALGLTSRSSIVWAEAIPSPPA
jgi:2-dehydro-3-deoxyphosphogluconate aldolase/(4S)-4-hydroxy-2-oxoglutarate aldolase